MESEPDKQCVLVLQKDDPHCKEIIEKCSKCAFYEFDKVNKQWKAADVEGPFYLYKRSAHPFYGFCILNTKQGRNLKQEIHSKMDFKLNSKFILYKIDNGRVLSLWFQNEQDTERIFSKIQSLLTTSSAPTFNSSASHVHQPAVVSASTKSQSVASNNPPHQSKSIPINKSAAAISSDLTARLFQTIAESNKASSTPLNKDHHHHKIISPYPQHSTQAQQQPNQAQTSPLTALIGQVFSNGAVAGASATLGNNRTTAAHHQSVYVEDIEKFVLSEQPVPKASVTESKTLDELVPPHLLSECSSSGDSPSGGGVTSCNELAAPLLPSTVAASASSSSIGGGERLQNLHHPAFQLNREQLRAAIIRTVEGDDDLVDRIHSAYISLMQDFIQKKSTK